VSSDAASVLCIGRLYCDLVFRGLSAMPVLGQERFAETVALVPGGGGFITAAHLASLGRPAALLARLGLDPLSQALEPQLTASGVDLRWLESADDAGPQPTVVIVQGGERAFLSRRAGPARPATLDAALASPQARHLHIAEFATLAEIPDLVSRAKRAGLSVSLDPSWDDDLIAEPDLVARCTGVDVFLPNAAEARAIAGTDDIAQAGRRLSRHFRSSRSRTAPPARACSAAARRSGCRRRRQDQWSTRPARATPSTPASWRPGSPAGRKRRRWPRASPVAACRSAPSAAPG
jgi:sugar/nucleoside kinase (ribokinase family)